MVSAKQPKPKKLKVKQLKKVDGVEKVKKIKPTKEVVTKPLTSKKNESIQESVAHPVVGPIKKKRKYVLPTKFVTETIVNGCLNALQQLAVHYKKKNKIFEDETPIFAELRCIKIQSGKGNIKFVLPHSTVASTGEVCLITPDLKKGRKHDHEPTVDRWEEMLRSAGVTSVKTVLPMRQLRVEYDQYELKRRLLTQHDFIMVDTRVLNHVSHLLGKMFFKKHNMLIPVRLDEKTLKKDIDTGLRTAMLRLNEGPTSTILVGHTGMSQNELRENVLSLVQQLRQKFPGGEMNIRGINLKFPLSVSLPLYLTLRPTSAVDIPKLKNKKPKQYVDVEGELSTMLGSTVRVAPDGTVHVKNTRNEDDSDLEEDSSEENNEEKEDQDNDDE